jgi:hypothetical protein
MASDPNAPRSRRALLTAAAGAAGAVAASAALPLTVAAAPANMQTEQDNPTIAETSVTQSAAGHIAFRAKTTNTDAAGLYGTTGTEPAIAPDTHFTGVFGWSPEAPFPADPQYEGAGVWGVSPDDGVVGTGGLTGVLGIGGDGVVGIGDGGDGVVGVGDTTTAGVRAVGATSTSIGLAVTGKVVFQRSGKNTIGTGRSSLTISLAGVSANSRIFAVLHSNRSGRYVRAVVPATNSFTIYLNTTVTSATFVAWFVLN